MEQQMGKRGRGQEGLPPPPPNSARSLFLYPHHLVRPPVLARLSLSQWEAVLSLSLPGTAKSDKASGPPQGLAWLPPASQEAVASQTAPGGRKIGSALGQLTLTAWPAPPLSARGSRASLSTPAPGGRAPFSLPSCRHGWPRPLPPMPLQPSPLVLTSHGVRQIHRRAGGCPILFYRLGK